MFGERQMDFSRTEHEQAGVSCENGKEIASSITCGVSWPAGELVHQISLTFQDAPLKHVECIALI